MKLLADSAVWAHSTTLCIWILDLLANKPLIVWIGGHNSYILKLNTGAPQGCVPDPLPLPTTHP